MSELEAADLHCDAILESGGPPVAFIHGFMSSNLQWEPNIERLATELQTFLIEQPGHGRSPVPPDTSGYRPEAVLAGIERIRNAYGLDRWWVVGHSMGGAIALRYALAFPDRVHGVVFTNSRAVFGIEREGAASARSSVTAPTDIRALPYHPIHARRFPADLKARMVHQADAMGVDQIAHIGSAAPHWRSSDELHTLAVPILLVNGRWEKKFQPNVEQARNLIPDLQIVHAEGGHSINIEAAEPFNAAVVDFVRQPRPPAQQR